MHALDSNTKKAAFPTYLVHHHYDAEKDDELTLEVGDLIMVSDQSDPGWWVGEKVKGGKAGWFPSNVRKASFSPVFCVCVCVCVFKRSVSLF